MSRLHVAFVSFHTSPACSPGAGDAGGMNVYIDNLARSLGELGVEVDVFTRAETQPDARRLGPGVKLVALSVGPPHVLAKEDLPAHAPAFAAAIAAYSRANGIRYDLLHSHYWQSGLASLALSRRWRVPLVHTHHTIGALKNRSRPSNAAPEPDLRLVVEREVVSAAALVTASTARERSWLDVVNARTIPPGVDHSVFRPGDRRSGRAWLGIEDQPLLVVAGRIQPLKGIELAIEALARLPSNAVLAVVGGPSGVEGEREVRRLRELAEIVGVAGRTRFVGPQSQERLADLYRAADALIVGSHTESFGLAALEAHACGTPVVGTAVGGLPDFVLQGRSGFLIGNRDPKLVAAGVEAVVASGDAFRAAAARSAARYSWSRMARTVLVEYERLAQMHQSTMRRKDSP